MAKLKLPSITKTSNLSALTSSAEQAKVKSKPIPFSLLQKVMNPTSDSKTPAKVGPLKPAAPVRANPVTLEIKI
jgi:hypothetical protein